MQSPADSRGSKSTTIVYPAPLPLHQSIHLHYSNLQAISPRQNTITMPIYHVVAMKFKEGLAPETITRVNYFRTHCLLSYRELNERGCFFYYYKCWC